MLIALLLPKIYFFFFSCQTCQPSEAVILGLQLNLWSTLTRPLGPFVFKVVSFLAECGTSVSLSSDSERQRQRGQA